MSNRKSAVFRIRLDEQNISDNVIDRKSTIISLISEIKPQMFRISGLIFASVVNVVSLLMMSHFLSKIIDIFISVLISSIVKGKSDVDKNELLLLLCNLGVILIVETFATAIQGIFSSDISSWLSCTLRKKCFAKFCMLPISYMDTHPQNEIYDVITEQIDVMIQCIDLFLSQIIPSVFLITGIIIRMFWLNTTEGILCSLLIPFSIFINLLVCSSQKYKKTPKNPDNTPDITAFYYGFSVLNMSGQSKTIAEKICEYEKSSAKYDRIEKTKKAISTISSDFVSGLFLSTILIFGAFFVYKGAFSIGTLFGILINMRKMFAPISHLSSVKSVVDGLVLYSSKIFTFLNLKQETEGNPNNKIPDKGTIEFDNVTFSYPETSLPVIKELTFSVNETGITVLEGHTGSGKTTAIKLMLNLYSPDSGIVKFGGTDIKEFSNDEYRKMFSMITQNATLYYMTIAENISYPESTPNPEKLKNVVDLCGINSLINTLPEGYNSIVESVLSDGQIQQILIARAIYNKSRFIILDETTSFLDPDTEKRITDLLKSISETCSIILIAHKGKTKSIADKIIHFD